MSISINHTLSGPNIELFSIRDIYNTLHHTRLTQIQLILTPTPQLMAHGSWLMAHSWIVFYSSLQVYLVLFSSSILTSHEQSRAQSRISSLCFIYFPRILSHTSRQQNTPIVRGNCSNAFMQQTIIPQQQAQQAQQLLKSSRPSEKKRDQLSVSIKFHFSRIVTQGEIPSDKRSVPNTHCCTLRRRELSMQCYTHQQISFTHRLLCTSRLFAFKFPRTICDGGCIASLKLFLHAICGSLGERVEVCMVSIPCQEHDYVCFLRP